MTPPAVRWINNPKTEAEWDRHILAYGQDFPHCYWLATHYPADK